LKNAVYLDFSKAIKEQGKEKIQEKYGNLFDMYLKITGYNAYEEPMMISPSAHFSMGGLWVDYELMTTIPGLFALGEANFADHGANRLGANSLLQASVDGYFIAPYTIANYLSNEIHTGKISTENIEFEKAENHVKQQIETFININGTKTVDHFHKTLGKLLYDYCGLARNEEGLTFAIEEIRKLKKEFYKDVKVSGQGNTMNSELEKAGRVADYFEIGELMCYDALTRNESCGAHFREEYQTPDGEALRSDAEFQFISAWNWTGENNEPELIKELLVFEEIQPTVRSYK